MVAAAVEGVEATAEPGGSAIGDRPVGTEVMREIGEVAGSGWAGGVREAVGELRLVSAQHRDGERRGTFEQPERARGAGEADTDE
jgi:hypothetical protein